MKEIPLHRNRLIFGCAGYFALTGCVNDPDLQKGMGFYKTVDAFQEALAKRAYEKINPSGTLAKDFQVVVTQSVDPVGTIYRASTSIPVSDTACKPSQEPLAREAPGLFPGTYTLSKSLAVELGLDEAVFKGLAKLGVKVSDADTLGLAIKDTERMVLDDESIHSLTEQPPCRSVLSGKRVWLVRGYISGIRDFSAKGDANVNFEGQITKIGNFKIEPVKDSRTIAVKDEKNQSFLQIVSEVTVQPQGTTTIKAISSADKPALVGGMIYIQIDKADSTGVGDELAKELRQSSINVAGDIERVQTARMPKNSQVRYFHDEDRTKAEQIQSILKKTRPDVTIARFGLPAPIGQLEVWLTKN